MRRDPLIIGGGPAGAAVAITLGKGGCRPVLLERSSGPTDKVCGDFLSADAIRHAQALGVEPLTLGATPIYRMRLIHGERMVEAALPFPALGLSRRALDTALLCQAEHAGARVFTGQTVRRLTREPLIRDDPGRGSDACDSHPCDVDACDSHAGDAPGGADLIRDSTIRDRDLAIPRPLNRNAMADDHAIHDPLLRDPLSGANLVGGGGRWIAQTTEHIAHMAETVFLATGKHDLRDVPRPRADRGAIGMKMYFALASGPAKTLEGTIELTLFPGGYAGMQLVEDGQAVLCIAIQRRAFQSYGGGWPGLIAAIEQRSRRFAAMLADARKLLPRPLAVAGIPYGYRARAATAEGLFRLGDQAAVIPSLTGDGMAIALHSGRAAAEAWLAGVDSAAYHHALAYTVAPQMRLAGLLHHACMSAAVQSAVTRVAALFPGLLRRAACHTRLPSCPGPNHHATPA
jgi:flavin-dependent dehydrogenase